MIKEVSGDIFNSSCYCLVNAVNIVGVMGGGLALQFKRKFPKMYKDYQRVCKLRKLIIGRLHLFEENNKMIVNFPTKTHYAYPSKLDYIKQGLEELKNLISKGVIPSVAIPALGCGLGGLDWESEVKPLIYEYLTPIQDICKIEIYNKVKH